MTTGEEEKKLGDKTGTGETPESKIPEETDKTKSDISDTLLIKAKIREKEIAEEFKGITTKDGVVAKFHKLNPSVYKDKSYEDILDMLKNGVKKEDGTYDTSLRSRDIHTRLQDNIGKVSPKKEKDKETEIKEKKKKLDEDKSTEPEKPKEKTEDDKTEDGEPEEKKPEEKDPKAKEDEKKPEEKKEKKEKKGGFRNKTGRAIARPFKTARKATKWTAKAVPSLIKSVAKTVRTPVGLTSYLLADMGTKEKDKRTGRKDRRAGYKKHRARTKKTK
ncbi:MAG: hypothetical protein NTX91_02345 [candidate division SR1 bacterium]|nr:hypothetical protein [candidate division SR1 bacterium]